jgi:two-component system chemotaxis sensor kinase CheA
MYSSKYKSLFLQETYEHLSGIEKGLLTLEKTPGEESIVDKLFRHYHSIKGMCASMGYNTMKRLTHAQEGILDGIRQTKGAVASQEMISVLLECLDVLKEMTKRIEEDRPHDIDIEPLTPSGAGLKLSSIMKVEGRVFDELLNLTGELLTVFSGLRAMAAQSRSIELKEEVYSLGKTIEALRTNILTSRMLPFQDLTQNLPRIVRDISRKNGKRIELKIEGSEISLDRSILEKMGDPLVHIIRNAVDHGIEDVDERKKAGKPDVGTAGKNGS